MIKEAQSEYPNSIKIFNERFAKLKEEFEKPVTFEQFASDACIYFNMHERWYNTKINKCIVEINKRLYKFVRSILFYMDLELERKGKTIIANDDEYFDIIPDIEEITQESDSIDRIIEIFKAEAKKIISSEEYKKLLPDFVKSLSEKLNQIDKLTKKSEKLDLQELKKILPKKIFLTITSLANANPSIEKHLISSIDGEVKIFPKGEPLPIEVRQAHVNDCYLMSTLISLAKTTMGKEAIKKCFVQGLDKIENEDEITVRLFAGGEHTYWAHPIYITVNKNKVIAARDIEKGALWPKLIEKAYAVYRKERYDPVIRRPLVNYEISGTNLYGGTGMDSMFAITGRRTGTAKSIGAIHRYGRSEDKIKEKYMPANIIVTIKNKLKKGNSLTCDFKNSFIVTDLKNQEKIEIKDNHSYAIVGFGTNDKGKEYIRLIEPNKALGRTYSTNVNRNYQSLPKEGGHVAMSTDDFKNHFLAINFTSNHRLI